MPQKKDISNGRGDLDDDDVKPSWGSIYDPQPWPMNVFNPRVGVVFQLPLPLSQQIFNYRKISFFQADVLSKLASSHKPSSISPTQKSCP